MADINRTETPLFEARNLRKRYGDSDVLRDVSLQVNAGEVRVLVGENGAGKSTLLRIAAGFVRQDRGSVWVDGHELHVADPRSALTSGVAFVSQELTSVPHRTVLENIFLGTGKLTLGRLDKPELLKEFRALAERIGSKLSPRSLVETLSQAERQELEILRALARHPRILILDEPTAALDGERSAQVLHILRQLAERNMAIILVSHRLNEVFSVADTISILRDGRLVLTERAVDLDETTLVRHMVGRELSYLYPERPPVSAESPIMFSANNLQSGHLVRGVSLEVRRGEIVGLAGLVGSGRSEFALAAFGAVRVTGGTVNVDGKPVVPTSIRQMQRLGLGMIPEDRHTQGLVLLQTIGDNIALPSLKRFSRWGTMSSRAIRERTEAWIAKADIRPASWRAKAGNLSGGNQQKVLIAKWLDKQPKFLIIDEPTRGVDIGAKSEIHRLIIEAARSGVGILLISSELEEVLNLSHRVVVFREGRIAAEFSADDATEQAVMAGAFGVKLDQASSDA